MGGGGFGNGGGGSDNNKLYVGNLSFQTRNEDLMDYFSEFGRVADATVVMERDDPGSACA